MRKIRPNPPPIGTVQPLPLLAIQSDVMIGELALYQPLARLTLMKG
jgi:hypothetical protein